MDTKLTVNQAAQQLNLSSKSIKRWLKGGKLNGEKVKGKWRVHVDSTFEYYLNAGGLQTDVHLAIDQLKDEMKQLQELLVNRDEQIESMNQQIERLSQLLAVSHRSLQQVTDQSQLLIADNRKSSFWKRLFGG